MKKKLNYLIILSIVATSMFLGCQKDIIETETIQIQDYAQKEVHGKETKKKKN